MAYRGGTLMVGNDKCYPNAYFAIGDLFFTTKNENPSVRFGGLWELFGKGRTLVCVDENDSDFNEVKKIGGEKTHTLTVNEMPYETLYNPTNRRLSSGNISAWDFSARGGSQPHNNVQPYITCYIWIRVK